MAAEAPHHHGPVRAEADPGSALEPEEQAFQLPRLVPGAAWREASRSQEGQVTETDKSICQEQPWRKTLSASSAKKLKGELFPEPEEETTDSSSQLLACGLAAQPPPPFPGL